MCGSVGVSCAWQRRSGARATRAPGAHGDVRGSSGADIAGSAGGLCGGAVARRRGRPSDMRNSGGTGAGAGSRPHGTH